jgi:hypothetical protein
VFKGSPSISSLDPPQIVSNTTLAHSHLQFLLNADNLVSFALANYVRKQIKSYPFLSVVYHIIDRGPMLPPKRESTDPSVIFAAGDNLVSFAYFTTTGNGGARQLKDDSDCPTVLKNDNGEDLEIGAPILSDQ